MKCINADALMMQADNAVHDTIHLATLNPKLDSYLAKFLVVYLSGIYEECIEQIVGEYASGPGDLGIENYIREQLDISFRNPNFDKIISLVKQFNTSWSISLGALKNTSGVAIDSIITNKNHVAHGESCTVTINDVVQYHRDARIVVETIDRLML